MGTPPDPTWLDELALPSDGPPWLAMGLRRIDEPAWLLPDTLRDDEIGERRRLLADHHAQVVRTGRDTEAAGPEVLGLVRAWFRAHRPDLTLAEDPPRIHPLEAAGRLVQEDLCLMVPCAGGHRLDAACLCFPSHWRLGDKIGRLTAEIHGPVPRYAEELSARVDRYLTRLRPGTISARRNWSVHDDPVLFAPVAPRNPERLAPEVIGDRLWLRSERQTLRTLTRTGTVLFTIRVQQAPFSALAGRPSVARALALRLAAQPAALTAMNGLTPHRDAVLTWLARLSD